jgi:rhodanese-related sulfurtransferase
MPVQVISSTEAIALLDTDALFLDVRSVPEFEAGHAPGAYNIPLLEMKGNQLVPNPQFAEQVGGALARDRTIVVSCKAGGRSARAAAVLEQLGFARVLDHGGGWSGNPTDPGWAQSGGPQTTEDAAGRSHRELRR